MRARAITTFRLLVDGLYGGLLFHRNSAYSRRTHSKKHPMATVRTRADLAVLLGRQMAASLRNTSNDEDIEGRAALKTYLLEAHGPMRAHSRAPKEILTGTLAPFGVTVENTDEDELLSLVAGEQVSWLDCTKDRPWRLHIVANVKDADRVHELLTSATPYLTPVRLLPAKLESLAARTESPLVLFSLRHDRRPLRPIHDSPGSREGVDVVTLRFWASTAAETLTALRRKDVLPGATSVSSVQLKLGDQEAYARVEVYHDGKCTAVGNSFFHFEKLLDAITAEYAEVCDMITAITSKGRRINVAIPWKIEAVEPAVARMFVGADPFALWGLPERLSEHAFVTRAVDLDSAQCATIEVSREGVAIELSPDAHPCIALRLLSNIQFHAHSELDLEPLFQLRAGGAVARPAPPFNEQSELARVAAVVLAETVAHWIRGHATVSVTSVLQNLFAANQRTKGLEDLTRKVLAEAAAYEWSEWIKPTRDDAGSTVWRFKVEPNRERIARTRQLARLYRASEMLRRRVSGANVEPWSQMSLFAAESLVPA